ncbi:Coiled-coil domain-containing protein 22 [Papilio xuthus]|uniref:Coiled-coil domain-containing protein 22 homolog n=1 Tax=Papilio xuthus TaxID=66420 RepID=A0A194PDD5_PAPXU|nr:Coiled-coil domain-containing protein 22 [Papilio xuthus]
MEEVDSIILHFLRQLKVNFNDDTKSLSDLSVDLIVEAASRCISTINPNVKVPSKLPPGVSQRIEVAAQIASICKDLGYKNDVGYQTFLYYNEAELRQVFMFLIEKLPNEDRHLNTTVPTKKKNVLLQEIANKINEELNTMWIPPCCKPNSNTIGDFIYTEDKFTKPKEISDTEIMEKLQKLNEITKKSTTVKQQETDNIVTKKIVAINKSLKELKETAFVLRQKLDTLESEKNIMDVEYSQATKYCEKAEADLRNVENILRDVGIQDIEDGTIEDKLDKVRKNINALHSKSENLTSKNLGLKVEIDKSERSKCKNILLNLKETAKALKDECEKKEELSKQLKMKYEKLKGGNKRHVYTERILEIIGNVEKQNLEIGNILQDTRKIQKEINTLEGQLDRCFSIADETLFKDAKKDDQAKKAYKLLALLHSECNTIVSLVNDTGNLARDIVDLEDNIKAEKSKRTEDILEKIQLDLTKLQKESL